MTYGHALITALTLHEGVTPPSVVAHATSVWRGSDLRAISYNDYLKHGTPSTQSVLRFYA